MKTEKTDDYELTFDDSQECKDKCYELLLAFFKEHEAFSGECICQNDSPQIEAPNLLSEIAEKAFKFDAIYNE